MSDAKPEEAGRGSDSGSEKLDESPHYQLKEIPI